MVRLQVTVMAAELPLGGGGFRRQVDTSCDRVLIEVKSF
jgi:hypothetical protein